MQPVIGIDLGTTNSCAAVIEQGKPLVVPMADGKVTLPSVVAFKDGQRLVGDAAKRQFVNNVENTIYATKRLIGRSFDDPQTQDAIGRVTYRSVRGPNGDVWIHAADRKYAIQEVTALVLTEIKEACRRHLAQDVTHAVIAVPAHFNDRQRTATKQAAKIAGLEVLRVINEPTAAALAFGMHFGAERRIAVYDLGGGTFDVSVLKVGGGAIEVLATDGDAFLGGNDFDHRILGWLVGRIEKQVGMAITNDPVVAHRLWEAAELAKIQLSTTPITKIALPFLTTRPNGEVVHFECDLLRPVYEELVTDLLQRTLTTFTNTLAAASLTLQTLDEVLLVGGMTRMPAIRKRMVEITGREPATGVHPDLAVAVGAAVQAAMLGEQTMPAVLLDVTPHNLGVMTVAGLAETVIPKNTKVPAHVERRFTTVRDDQETVRIVVYQGDSRQIDKNEILGEFQLESIRKAQRGQVQIDVGFSISTDGIVHVTATDVETGKAQEIKITSSVGLSKADLERMIAEHQQPAPATP
ncbi:MAG: Hsp70 family protein [Deltaproteobacteria bacterium]|nr:Hsp70 family protein [Deltaproteobacteria bacterium]